MTLQRDPRKPEVCSRCGALQIVCTCEGGPIDPVAATTRLSWHERITRAVETYREWLHVLPNELGMDRAMKAAGFRDVIVENHRLRAALKHIADWPDDNMETAKTLHYDMRGWAREALNDDA